MKKQTYKIGQKVRIVKCSGGNPEHEVKVGKITKIYPGYAVVVDWNGDSCAATKVEPYVEHRGRPRKPKSLIDTLKVGDIVVDNGGYYREVRKVITAVVLSYFSLTASEAKKENDGATYINSDLVEKGIKLYTPPAEKKYKLKGTYTKDQLKKLIEE